MLKHEASVEICHGLSTKQIFIFVSVSERPQQSFYILNKGKQFERCLYLPLTFPSTRAKF